MIVPGAILIFHRRVAVTETILDQLPLGAPVTLPVGVIPLPPKMVPVVMVLITFPMVVKVIQLA